MKIKLSNLTGPALLGLALLGAAGCSKPVDTIFRRNLPPEVRLTRAPVKADSQDPAFYAYRMNWVGYDPDGRVDHYLLAVDPPRADSVDTRILNEQGRPIWSPTTKLEEVVFFRATEPDSVPPGQNLVATATDFHVFAIAAVDDKGAISKPVSRAFFSYTQAPIVSIVNPSPNSVFTHTVTPSVRISWTGIDPDGQTTIKPVKYRFRLFGQKNPDLPYIDDFVEKVRSDPNFLRWIYAPTFGPSDKCPTCTAWDSSSADTTNVQYTNLVPDQYYLFAVTGFDEAGAYDPIFSLDKNVLRFAVNYAGTLGPTLCMFNEFFTFCYDTGGYGVDESRYFNIEIPENQPVTFYWFAEPPEGAAMRSYRWALDLQDLKDETPRTNELTDYHHWSARSLQTISASLPGFSVDPTPDHLFYIEAEDNNGLRSLGIIHFTVVRATFENELLIVDDTRLAPDTEDRNHNINPPREPWPTAAELDTFFYARGGKPWKCYPGVDCSGNQIVGQTATLTTGGIFNGYPFDTLGTRGILSGAVPLAKLGRYRLVVWYTDDIGATYYGSPLDQLAPQTSLRYMSGTPFRGAANTISTYLKQGGRVWMFGGGAAYASLIAWNKANTPYDDWTNADNELIPGRFMYDFPHWQSAVGTRPAEQAAINTPAWSPGTWGATNSVGRNWSGQGLSHQLSMPNYNLLTSNPRVSMQILRARTCATDPPPPFRGCNSFWVPLNYSAEFIGRPALTSPPNNIREDADPTDGFREESTLDTLYSATGGTMPGPLPVMTYYHGFQSPQMVFSGFPIWYFQRKQCIELVDFVMQQIFGLAPPPAGARGPSGPAPARSVSIIHPASVKPLASSRTTMAPLRR